MNIKSLQRRVWLAAGLALITSLVQAAEPAPRVKFSTSAGEFVLELYPDKAPKTVENFLKYVSDKHFDGTVFHRVMGNFMIQGGGFTPDMQQKPTREPIVLEANSGLKNDRGTVAMARTGNPNSATAQFFINVVDNNGLNAPMPDGPTGNKGMHQNVPLTPILINSALLQK
jgi:peptidyl-prolyl cis-trans isomerase A (cyclophilin A)